MTNIRARQPYSRRPAPQSDLKPFLDTEFANIQRAIPVPLVRAVFADDTVQASDDTVEVDSTAGAVTITLPPPDRLLYLRVTILRTTGANGVTVAGAFPYSSTLALRFSGDYCVVQSDGVAWRLLSRAEDAWFDVTAYGATGNGTSDDTTAVRNAVAAACVAGGIVFFPLGTYLLTDTITIDAPGVTLAGVGYLYTFGSSILFNPASAKVCFDFIAASSASPLFCCGVRDLVGASTNSVRKTFVRAVDVSEFSFATVRSDSSWAGNGSIGVEIQGREFVRTHNCTFFSDRPLVLSQNPRHATIDIDTFTFTNTYLGATDGTFYNVTIGDTGVAEIRSLRNLCFDGLFMVQGKGGISWVSTITLGAQDCVGLQIIRGGIEQTMDSSGWFLNIERPTGTILLNLDLHLIQPASTGQNGIRLRRTDRARLDFVQWPDTGGTRKWLDIDGTCARTSWDNLETLNAGSGAGSSIVGQHLIQSFVRVSSGDYSIVSSAAYDNAPTGVVLSNTGIGKAATSGSSLSIAGLPTSSVGLVSGDVWSNANVLTIVP